METIEYVPHPFEEVKISPNEYELAILKNAITKETCLALVDNETGFHIKLDLSDSCNDISFSEIELLFIAGSPKLRFFKNVYEIDKHFSKSDVKIVLVIEK